MEQGFDVIYNRQVMQDSRCLNNNVRDKESEELSIDRSDLYLEVGFVRHLIHSPSQKV